MLSSAPLLGSTTPRIWTPPRVKGRRGPCGCGCALTKKTSKGFAAVEFARDILEIELLPWQRWLLIHALELRPDGRFRFRTVLILVARQNGKTTLVEVKNLFKLFVLQVKLVIGTAQNLDVSEESWDKAVEIIEGVPDLNAELVQVNKVNGKKFFKLASGSRWKIAAASRKGGRGLSGDDVNLDELREHLVWDSWAAVTKTTMARPNPQVFAFSNAGDDRSIVLNDLQAKGRAAVEHPDTADPTLGIFEWSAPDDVKCSCEDRADGDPHTHTCRLQDREVWAMANPSLGYTVTEEALASALATDPEPIFLTECLCQRVPDLAGEKSISDQLWRDQVDGDPRHPLDRAFAVQVNAKRTHTAIAAVGPREDGTLLASLVAYQPGTHWVAAKLAALKAEWNPLVIAAQDKGPTGVLFTDFERVGLKQPEDRDEPERGDLVVPWAAEVAIAYGLMVDAVNQRRLFHVDDMPLNVALAGSKTRSLSGGTAWAFDTEADASPLLAVTLAVWAWETLTEKINEDYDVADSFA